jgi:hypothetical protein
MDQGNIIDNLFKRGKEFVYKTPSFFRPLIFPVRLIFSFIYHLRVDEWILTGEESSSRQQLAIMYSGTKEKKNYFANLAFNNLNLENHVGRRWLWQVATKSERIRSGCSLIINEVPARFRNLFKKKECFYIPEWLICGVDIPDNIHSLVDYKSCQSDILVDNKSIKSDLRRINNNKLCFEVAEKFSQYQDFYYNMFVPYITKIHGNMALIPSYEWMKTEFKHSDLLLIKKDGKQIAGVLLNYWKKRARLWAIGIKDGDLNYLKQGVTGASYYFSFCHLRKKGYKTVSLGGSRAFLKDGVLRYKKKWGAKIIIATKSGYLLNIMSMTEGVKGFLTNNPFVYIDKIGLIGAIFLNNDQLLRENNVETTYKGYSYEGISKWIIYRFTEDNHLIKHTSIPLALGT